MIAGVGIDIIDIRRIKTVLGKKTFMDKVFLPEEQSYCNSKRARGICFSGTFAAKEAVIKAVSQAKSINLVFEDILIQRKQYFSPNIKLKKKLKNLELKLSIAHTATAATAVCIAFEKKDERNRS